jgi:hypothetical protein
LDNIDDGQISMMASFPFVKRSAIRLSLPDWAIRSSNTIKFRWDTSK